MRDVRVTFGVFDRWARWDSGMLMAYVDESGDPGRSTGSSPTYTLGCVLVRADNWPDAFGRFVAFRRELRDGFRLRMSDEVKANYLLHDRGDLGRLHLSFDERREIYHRHMQLVPRLPARTFAVVIKKDNHPEDTKAVDVTRRAWKYLAQRLSNSCHKYHEGALMVIHDEGENSEIRRILRMARRYLTAGSAVPERRPYVDLTPLPLVDDPVPRQSHLSYFTQMADLVAYAAYRKTVPPERSCVCTDGMWSEMGRGIRWETDSLTGDRDGIVYD
jgi:hypothetical protein